MSLYLKKRKRYLKKALVGFTLFFLGLVILSLFSLLSDRPFNSPSWNKPYLNLLVMSLIAILVYKPLDNLYTKFFRNVLFKKKSFAHMMLMNLAEDLKNVLDLHELGNLTVNTFGEVLHLKSVALLVHQPAKLRFDVVSAFGWNVSDAKRVRFNYNSGLIELMRSAGSHVLVRERVVRALSWLDANRLSHDFNQLHSSWVIPLYVKSELVGALGFSSVKPESIFDEADFQFFREFAETLAPCVRNALRYHELEETNQKLQDVQSELLQTTKREAIEQLATGIAHEIHNPLTIISGKAQVLLLKKDKVEMGTQVEEVLKTIVQQTKRAADITRKLLMFSQGSGVSREPLNLLQVLNDTIALVSYQTSLEGIQMASSSRGVVPMFQANVHEMREVFLNLILNAVQSVGSQGKIHCELNGRPQDQLIEISISDTGSGIPADALQKVFNPFFTTRPDAVGLGLFVTKQIVHRYGGSIRAQSRQGEGSLFVIQFPYMELFGPMTADSSSALSLFPA